MAEKTDKIIEEVETVPQQYMSLLLRACSNIYLTLDSLSQIHFLYQYSPEFFLDIFHSVLYKNTHHKGIGDNDVQDLSHLSVVISDLIQAVYCRVARGMLRTDRITFAISLCRIHLHGLNAEPHLDIEFQHFLRGKDEVIHNAVLPDLNDVGLGDEAIDGLARLSTKFPAFKGIVKRINESSEEFKQFLNHNTPELCVPVLWDTEKSLCPISQAMMKLLVIQAVRPDRVIAAGHQFVDAVFTENFMPAGERELDLQDLIRIVDKEVKPGTPVLLCYTPEFDVSGRVDDLATKLNRQIASIDFHSMEDFSQAEKAIDSAVKTGSWVMLKKVHRKPQWLAQLDKMLHSLQIHQTFRLFLTTEINPNIPVDLLRVSHVLVFEPPQGIRANLLRTFNALPAGMIKPPYERTKLYFLLTWFHVVVQERSRYCPLGWSKDYDFNEFDLQVACKTLDTCVDAKGLQSWDKLPAEKVAWDVLRTLLSLRDYGSKIDNEFDKRLLDSIVSKLFTPKSFEPDFLLVSSKEMRIAMPAAAIFPIEFLYWMEHCLPNTEDPTWLGLPSNAEKALLTTRGTDMVTKLQKIWLLEDDEVETACLAFQTKDRDNTAAQRRDGRPAWKISLLNSARAWMRLLPYSLVPVRRTVENIKDPFYRFFEREINIGAKLLQDVRQDLSDVLEICRGEKKETNYHRQMISQLVKGILPDSWRRYTIPADTSFIKWITDFSLRIKQLQRMSLVISLFGAQELQSETVWLGGFFNPEAYVSATRIYVARTNSCPVCELTLDVTIEDEDSMTVQDGCFGLKGLKLQGAVSKANKLHLTSAMMTDLPLICLRWTRRAEHLVEAGTITLPVYLNANRTEILFKVELNIADPEEKLSFYERGVALVASTSLN